MGEARFRDILSVKIDASVHVARQFEAEPLDFILYFSSIVALEKNGGLSGYAAGGAFEDALALHLHGRCRFPVKRSEEHTSELQSLMRISYAVFCLKKKKKYKN